MPYSAFTDAVAAANGSAPAGTFWLGVGGDGNLTAYGDLAPLSLEPIATGPCPWPTNLSAVSAVFQAYNATRWCDCRLNATASTCSALAEQLGRPELAGARCWPVACPGWRRSGAIVPVRLLGSVTSSVLELSTSDLQAFVGDVHARLVAELVGSAASPHAVAADASLLRLRSALPTHEGSLSAIALEMAVLGNGSGVHDEPDTVASAALLSLAGAGFTFVPRSGVTVSINSAVALADAPAPPSPSGPPPPPSPPPPPPSAPSTSVSIEVQAEGEVEDYPPEVVDDIRDNVAEEAGVNESAVSVEVLPGSVLLRITIALAVAAVEGENEDEAAAAAAVALKTKLAGSLGDPEAASSVLGVNVTAAPSIYVQCGICDAPLPPPSDAWSTVGAPGAPLLSPSLPPEPDADLALSLGLAGGALAVLLLAGTVGMLLRLRCLQRRLHAAAESKDGRADEDGPAPQAPTSGTDNSNSLTSSPEPLPKRTRTGKEKHRVSVMSSLSDISRRGKKEGPGKQTFRKGSVVHV